MRRFSIEINERGLCIFADGVPVIDSLIMRLCVVRLSGIKYIPHELICEGDSVRVRFCRAQSSPYTESKDAELIFTEVGGVLTVSVSVSLARYIFSPSGAVNVDFSLLNAEGAVSLYQRDLCWLYPDFSTDTTALHQNTESLSAKIGDKHVCLLPISSHSAAARLERGAFALHTRVFGAREVRTAFAVISCADDPYAAMDAAVGAALREKGAERQKPAFSDRLGGLGWCTWESFGPSVSAEKILEKLDEYAAAGRVPKWVLIDDGWATYRENRLLAFSADRKKFPDGLGALVKRMREEYGVEHVGVWCAMNGHWGGLDEEHEYAKKYREELYTAYNGALLLGDNADAVYRFWDEWFSYLRGEGVDFVKVDNQGNVPQYYDGNLRGSLACDVIHKGLEAAAKKHFDGALINCMGASLEQAMVRENSVFVRCSGDYMPEKPDHLAYHITQSVYCAAMLSRFHVCDYDMFYSDHGWAHANALTCAISGGPVYTSDRLGRTSAEILSRLSSPNGGVGRFDTAAVPTLDCFYTDCATAGVPLKVFSSAGENFALAAYGFSKGKTVLGVFELSQLPSGVATAEKYLGHDYFADRYFLFGAGDSLPISLDYEACALYSFYPVKNGKVAVGDRHRYAEAAESPCFMGAVDEIIGSEITKK